MNTIIQTHTNHLENADKRMNNCDPAQGAASLEQCSVSQPQNDRKTVVTAQHYTWCARCERPLSAQICTFSESLHLTYRIWQS